jgi:hypothetical protein
MKFLLYFLVMIGLSISAALTPAAYADECRLEGNLRIDTAEDAAGLDNICEISGNLLIFAPLAEELVIPRLRSVKLINIETDGIKAIYFPALESASWIYVKGQDFEVVDFPVLRTVHQTFYMSAPAAKFLNLTALERATNFYLANNDSLEYVFADHLQSIGGITLENNPVLAEESSAAIGRAGRLVSREERQEEILRQQQVRDMQIAYYQSLRTIPAGPSQAASFGTIGGFGFHPRPQYNRYYQRYWHSYGYYPYWNYLYPYPWRWYL